MKPQEYLKLPFWLFGIAGTQKSLRKNPVLGSPYLNRLGLHRARVKLAARMAAARRARLAAGLSDADRRAFDDNGYFLTKDFLPRDDFEALRKAAFERRFEAREMRQGPTVTRMVPLPPAVLARHPAIARTLRDPRALAQIRYAASQGGEPLGFFQTVIAAPSKAVDPQTNVHSDTFHATSKAWLFLQDVGEDDGPFCFVPGSHRLTPERLDWQHACSLSAAADRDSHHASGSFRVRPEDLSALGLPAPVRMTVPANTLIVADTFAFHGRAPSDRPTLRCELHWHMRRNPFLPWTGLDPKSLPGLRGRELELFMALSDAKEKYLKKRHIWRPVGEVAVNAPAQI
ncbi:phytanoyl-CoA dioxygenase family protein [Stappia stellulata]|uniref:phytanoyl-CoA dioxygenase family protein n=1 Tax=Stappia stellulata TaxID=71235 RepID=UPI001CD519F6|nr:phytanoyl-CoA dioxygenase family protein [Stappia stellulata]MCA1242292.1 phytanoyl-CoA dioxygenase family protein [Stappia stellulata]